MVSKQVEPVLKFFVSIKGDKWLVRFYTLAAFDKIYPGCAGMTEYSHEDKYRTLNFLTYKLGPSTIAHEIMHALLSYRALAKKTPGAVEEQVCEEIGKSYARLHKLTKYIYGRFKNRTIK